MLPRLGAFVLVAASLMPAELARAQTFPDEQSRREALQFYRAGREFMSAERFDRAAEEFTKAVERDPLFTLAHYDLGRAYMSLQRYASAIRAFNACIEAARALHGLSETSRFEVERRRDDEIREARELMERLQRAGRVLQATRVEAYLNSIDSRRTANAGTAFRPPAEVLLSLGSAYFRTDRLRDAETQWKAAVDVNPRFGEAHNNLAALYAMTGRRKEAEDAVRAAERAGYRVHPQLKDDIRQLPR